MADNDKASGSHQNQYWEMSMDDEHHQPRYEGIKDDSTDPEYTNDSGDDCGGTEADPTTDDGIQHIDGQATDGSQPKRQKRTGTRTSKAPSRRNLPKWVKMGFQRPPDI